MARWPLRRLCKRSKTRRAYPPRFLATACAVATLQCRKRSAAQQAPARGLVLHRSIDHRNPDLEIRMSFPLQEVEFYDAAGQYICTVFVKIREQDLALSRLAEEFKDPLTPEYGLRGMFHPE